MIRLSLRRWPPSRMICRLSSGPVLGAALAAPMALVSSWRRGYLPGLICLLAVVIVTQLVTAIGTRAWFPYAAPALWTGLSGAAAAPQPSTTQLLLPLPVTAIAVLTTHNWWQRAEAR
jgi:ABC-2 type transport system permease protein